MPDPRRSLGPFALVAALLLATPALAQKDKPKPGGGGGYTLVDLVSPYHAIDGNWSDTEAIRVSTRASSTSPVYVIGRYQRDASGPQSLPCSWTVQPSGSVAVLDLSAALIAANAVNSSGTIGGIGLDGRPAVRLPSGVVVTLPTPNGTPGRVRAITELSGAAGARTFQAVGTHDNSPTAGANSSLWTLSESGTVLKTVLLRDNFGNDLYTTDINNDGRLGGSIVHPDGDFYAGASAALAEITSSGLTITPLILDYAGGVYLWGVHVNDSGDVMAEAGERIPDQLMGNYRRTFVWPASGGMINLSDLNGGRPVAGLDIAMVDDQLQVVGEASSSNGWFAFLSSGGQLRNINNLVTASSWNLWGGRGISNDGHIVGRGRLTVKRNIQQHGFLLLKQ